MKSWERLLEKHNSSSEAKGEQILYITKYGRNYFKCKIRKQSQVIKKCLDSSEWLTADFYEELEENFILPFKFNKVCYLIFNLAKPVFTDNAKWNLF